MKKKIISIVMASSLLLAGVVSAASMWGSYKGNDIIRITSNGVALKTSDVPAISYNGRTMIPISMLGQIGLGYNWDQANKTVDVVNISTEVTSSTSINNLKSTVRYADYFNSINSLSTGLNDLSSFYFTVSNRMISKESDSMKLLSQGQGVLNDLINQYNSLNESSINFIDSDISSILKSCYDSINYYKDMDLALAKFYTSNSKDDLLLFGSKNTLGIKSAVDASSKSKKKYYQYINEALNTK